MRALALLLALASALALLTSCSRYVKATKDVKQSVPHVGRSALVVKTRNGNIDVQRDANAKRVEIVAKLTCGGRSKEEAEKRVADATLGATRGEDGTLTIEPKFPGPKLYGPDGASITIRIPDARRVRLHSSNGTLIVAGLSGTLDADTSNGNVEVREHDGPATVKSSNGKITASDIGGALSATTSNGSIRADVIRGPAKLRSSNGRIRIELAPGQTGPVDVRTSNGSVEVEVGSAFRGQVRFDTSNGRITIEDRANRVRSRDLRRRGGTIVVGDENGPPSTIKSSNGNLKLTVVD